MSGFATWPARLRFALAHPDPWRLAALLLAAFAVVLHLVVLPARQTRSEALDSRLAEVEREGRRLAIAAREAAPQEGGMLAGFVPDERLAGELGSLLARVEAAGLQMSGAEYRLAAVPGRQFERYLLNLPVRGSYAEVRAFLADLRRVFPALAVEDVALRREAIGDTEVEAQLRLVFFVHRQEER